MKLITQLIPAIITSALLTTAAFATQDDHLANSYSISLYKDCQLVARHKMNQQQITHYHTLVEQETKMALLQQPIAAIEQQLETLSQNIETLTSLAITETKDSLHIDKNYLEQQEQAVEKLNKFMAVHQQNFDALEEQGTRLGGSADVFSAALELELGDMDYDNIQISTSEQAVMQDNAKSRQCHSHGLGI